MPLLPAIQSHVRSHVLPDASTIPEERQTTLARLAAFVSERIQRGQPAALTFICTHNSRRSQLAQVWATAAAEWFELEGVRTFSGGTETTAFDPRAVAALQRVGFQIETSGTNNPRHRVRMGPRTTTLSCSSKHYRDRTNPSDGFAAIMVCAAADASCPTITGAALRVGLPYDDPKESDDTPQETACYDERSRQIATEMVYLMSLVRA